jgi:hypothetical protein
MIYIYLRKKLMTCDSVLPLCLEAHEFNGIQSRFVTTDPSTYNQIRQNVVLLQAIQKVGSLVLIGSAKGTFFRKLQIAAFLLELAIAGMSRKHFLIHFGQFNAGLNQKVSRFFKSDKLIFSATDSSGFSAEMYQNSYRKSGRTLSISKIPAPKHGRLLSFCDKWIWLDDPRTRHLPRDIVEHPPMLKGWQKFITQSAKRHLRDLDLKKKVVVIMLGYFGELGTIKNENSVQNCLTETLSCLEDLSDDDISIILKPHVITDMQTLSQTTSQFKKLDFHTSYLHPYLLSGFATAVICNVYTTSVYNAKLQRVPVIEYAEYHPKTLEASRNKSIRPEYVDYFINRNQLQLKQVLKNIFQSKDPKKVLHQTKNRSEFFSLFA